MYWVKIGEVHYDLAEAWLVRDHRKLSEEERSRPVDPHGGVPPETYVSVAWRRRPEPVLFQGEDADEFMRHFEAFARPNAGRAPTDRPATD